MDSKAFFTFNLPLQLWPGKDWEDTTILNYMPRRQTCVMLNVADVIGQCGRDDFLEQTALRLENLARLFRAAKDDPQMTVYYPDEGL